LRIRRIPVLAKCWYWENNFNIIAVLGIVVTTQVLIIQNVESSHSAISVRSSVLINHSKDLPIK